MSQHFCGCCGRQITEQQIWCIDCARHVKPSYAPLWEQTHEAQTGEPCPYKKNKP